MVQHHQLLSLIILMSAVPFFSSFSAMLDCSGGIISSGDMQVDLLSKCGKPDSKESHDATHKQIDQRVRQNLFVMMKTGPIIWSWSSALVTLKNTQSCISVPVTMVSAGMETRSARIRRTDRHPWRFKKRCSCKMRRTNWNDNHEDMFGENLASGMSGNTCKSGGMDI